MTLVRYRQKGCLCWGVARDGGVADVSDAVGRGHGAIHAHLSDGGLRALRRIALDRSLTPLAEIEYAPFLPDPGKILCVGVNYPDRNEEYRDGTEAPPYPSLFLRTPDSFTAHRCPLLRPRESQQLDYEGEIVLVVGREGRRIGEAEAWAHIAGVTLMNEGTIRDWVRHAKFNVTQGKNFDHSGAIGPYMVYAGDIDDPNALQLETRVNGELRQSDVAGNMLFPIPRLISYISSFTTLRPGDLISTGTPTGAGARFNPPRYLRPGDVVDVSCEAIGTLSNGVADD